MGGGTSDRLGLVTLPASSSSGVVVAADGLPALVDEWLTTQYPKELTRKAYRSDLAHFAAWLALARPEGAETLLDVRRRKQVAAFREMLVEAGFAPATVNRRLAAISEFYQYLVGEGLYSSNPATGTKHLPVSDVSPRVPLTDEEARRLLAAPDARTYFGLRDRAILSLLLYLALRRASVAELRVGMLRFERGFHTLRFPKKGGGEHLLPLPAPAIPPLRDYLEADNRGWVWQGVAESADPLFPACTRSGSWRLPLRPLSRRQINEVVRKAVRAAGLRGDIDVHTLRHTAATNALEHGAPLDLVQDFLGHKDPKTTRKYAHRRELIEQSAAHLVRYDG